MKLRTRKIVSVALVGLLWGACGRAEETASRAAGPNPVPIASVGVGSVPIDATTFGTARAADPVPEPTTSFAPPPPVAPPGPSAAELAAQKALEEKIAAANALAAAQLKEKADGADGSFNSSITVAKSVNGQGADQAATMGALFCAQAANNQAASDEELASQNFGSCKQYFDAAGGIRGAAASPYKADASTLGSDVAMGTLEEFEKNFGVSGSDYMGRMLGSGGNLKGALQEMTQGKLDGETLAKAFENGTAPEGSKFEVNLALAGTPKARMAPPASLASSLKKALAKDASKENRESYRKLAQNSPAPVPAKGAKLADLEPLREGIFAEKEASIAEPPTVELTLFNVVHNRYLEVIKRKAL